ncbi:Histidine-containing phosphotransfer protein 6 [Asimina triloba]
MLGLGADRLRADMNRLLSLLFHQVAYLNCKWRMLGFRLIGFFMSGVLDEQFLQLQQLQDETSPNFVSEVVGIYFRESEKLLRNLRALLLDRECLDYKKMGIHLNQFMGSSSSIGAKRVRNVCVAFRAASEQNNRAGYVSY